MSQEELERLFREKATREVEDGIFSREFGFVAKMGEISHRNRKINSTTIADKSASQFAESCEHFLKAPIIYHDLRRFSNVSSYSTNSEINDFIDSSLKRPLWIRDQVFRQGDIRRNVPLSLDASSSVRRFSGHDLFAYYQLQNPIIKTLINHEYLSNDGEDAFNYIDFAILTQDFIHEDENGIILLPQRQLEIYNKHKETFETLRYSSTHDGNLQASEEDIDNLIQISGGLETIMCTFFPTYDSQFDFSSSRLEKEIGDNIISFYRPKNSIAKPIMQLDKISNYYLNNDFTRSEFENLLNSLNQINNITTLNEQAKELFKNIYLNLCIYLKHCSIEFETGIYFSQQVFKRIENYCKVVMNSNLFHIGSNQLRNTTYFIKNKELLQEAMKKSKDEYKKKVSSDVKQSILEKIIEFINILNSGDNSVLKRYTNRCFKDGTSPGSFWYKHKEIIIKKLFDELKENPEYDTARKIIDEYIFSTNIESKVNVFIEMLNTGNTEILKLRNHESFENYPNVMIGYFFQHNKEIIIKKLFDELKENPEYDTARQTILTYYTVNSVEEYYEKKTNTKEIKSKKEEIEVTSNYTTSDMAIMTFSEKFEEFIHLLEKNNLNILEQASNYYFSDGTQVFNFWYKYKEKIIELLFEKLSEKPEYNVAREIINNYINNKKKR